ncbi:MAG TPA: response regulator transcription factor [Candidatus Acidoferrum sp.]
MRLLLAEVDGPLAKLLHSRFQEEHFQVQTIHALKELGSLIELSGFDLALVDLSLAATAHTDLLRAVQNRCPDTPIIVLSDEVEVEERVRALNAGADDFVLKPFAVEELVARVHAVLRRSGRPNPDVLQCEDLAVNRISHEVRRAGRVIELSPTEYALLELLLRHTGRPVRRRAILEQVWQMRGDTITNVVDVYINYLRRKIDAGFDQPLIRTIRGFGYQIGEHRRSRPSSLPKKTGRPDPPERPEE